MPKLKQQATLSSAPILRIDPKPLFELSPYLYMQFMEPLGTTDGSVEAAWEHEHDRWREDVIAATRELSPTLIRWGGCFSSYYRWKEGIGPRNRRKPMANLLWGGMESNQVGTHEFLDFCKQVGADALLSVNFESDGRLKWAYPAKGGRRTAGPHEAAEWVGYCNNPSSARRRANGAREPFNVRLWQIGNETSYDPNGYDCETAARRTLAFARAMRKADPSIQLIGWGDSGWAPQMAKVAGEYLSFLAFHHHFNSGLPDSPLNGTDYRKSPNLTWRHLMHACQSTQAKLDQMREQTAGLGLPLAMTESHFVLGGRNRGEALSTWAAGVANARILNVHERNGDILKIATLADFCGTRWMNNAVMIPTPRFAGSAYLMPVARVMSLYRKHVGRKAVRVAKAPKDLDVTASRTGSRLYLHIINPSRTRPATFHLSVDGMRISSARCCQIAADPEFEVMEKHDAALAPVERSADCAKPMEIPPASVTAMECEIRPISGR